jgi:hypothetical protein
VEEALQLQAEEVAMEQYRCRVNSTSSINVDCQ